MKLLLSVLLLLGSVSYGQSKPLNATDILDAYKNAMENSLIHRERSTYKAKDILNVRKPARFLVKPSEVLQYTYLRDRDRIDYRNEFSMFDGDQLIPLSTKQFVRDKKIGLRASHSMYRGSSWSVNTYSKELWRHTLINGGLCEGALTGYIDGDAIKPLWEVLEGESDLRLRDEMEVIDGHKTYVLESKTNHGHYTLWIDPNSGFNLRRCIVHRSGNDIYNNQPLPLPPISPSLPTLSDVPLRPQLPVVEHTVKVDSIKIENIDGIFIPVEVTVTLNRKYSNGEKIAHIWSHKRFDIDLDPDFSKIEGAFVFNVPNGTRVRNRDIPGGGVPQVWQNGEIIPVDIQP